MNGSVPAARDDQHELELISSWCRAQLERDPEQRLLVVDSRLRQRRRQYERLLSQTLSPAEWQDGRAREFSTLFAIEGGQPLTDFPLVAHARCAKVHIAEDVNDVDDRWKALDRVDADRRRNVGTHIV